MSRIKNLRIIKHFEDCVCHKIHGIYMFDIDGSDDWKDTIVIRHDEEIKNFSFWLGEPISECLKNIRKEVADELIECVEFELMSQKQAESEESKCMSS